MAPVKLSIAAILLLIPALASAQSSSAQSSSLGLLFTTPQERAYLDYLREDFLQRTASQGFDIQTEEIPEIEAPEPEQNVEFRLDAVITNQDGSHTIWLNGAPVREWDLPQDVSLIARSGQNMLQISTSSASYQLKPGQTINLTTGELWESFERRPGTDIQEETAEQAEEGPEEFQAESAQLESEAPPSPANLSASQTQAQAQGVVAIQDLIEALQMIQSNNNEAASDAGQ